LPGFSVPRPIRFAVWTGVIPEAFR
jgi:hypothetical protein